MLEDDIAKMWFRTDQKAGETEDGKKITAAQEDAVDSVDDFKFSFNISLIRDDVERNPVNAENILHCFKKEIEPCFKKLDERLRLVCLLDWYTCLFRMLEEIAAMPKERHKKKTVAFVSTLDMQSKWNRDLARYRELEREQPEEKRLPSFDSYIEDINQNLAQPDIAKWKKAAVASGFRKTVKRVLALAVAVVLVSSIWQIYRGVGPLARALNIHRPRLVTEETVKKQYGSLFTREVSVKDFNASTILDTEDDMFSDRNLMDGDTTAAWAEGEKNDGTGKRLYFNIDGTQYVHYIVIWNGWQKDDETFSQYNALHNVTIRIDNGESTLNTTINLKDRQGPQYILINQNVDRFWIIMNTVYRGDASENVTCVSEVAIH